jgi:hypothetical protein
MAPPTTSPPSKTLTSQDLAFIDAAIALQKAAAQLNQTPPSGGPTVTIQPALFIAVIQLVVAVVQVATFVYHAVKGTIPVNTFITGVPTGTTSTASVQDLIAQRNALAKELGVTTVLK